jgi:hypothetical protein
MSEENKNIDEITEEKKEIDFSDQNEPIDSIEKTVADLKKKIQGLTEGKDEEDDEAEPEIPDFINAEKDQDNEPKSVSETVNESIEALRKNASKVLQNPELQKTIDFIKDNAVKAADAAKTKFDEIKADPKVAEAGEKSSAVIGKAREYAEEAGRMVSEGTKKVVKAADEFMNKPEVQDALEKVRTATAETAKKGIETLKNLISPEQKPADDEEIEAQTDAGEAMEKAEEEKTEE